MKTLTLALFLFTLASIANASKEGILALSSFRLESEGIGSSGKIIVEGKQDEKGRLAVLKITAFGKTFNVPKDKLAELADILSNGVRISYEQGYINLGGRTIYIQLQMGFTSHTRKQALITIAESGVIEVSAIETIDS